MMKSEFLCGAVEGFYGRPWSAGQRSQLFSWMQQWGLNTYLYAPKDDLKHRALWRVPYDNDESAALRTAIEASQAKGIRFVYGLAPGLDAHFAEPAGLGALQEKIGQLSALGCTHFALLFDDIVAMPITGALGLPSSVADEQIRAAHALLAPLRKKNPSGSLMFCPTPYCGRMAGPVRNSAYLRRLGERLDPAVPVLWTGPEIISETIPPESIRELAAVIGRKPILWDNLHANDYDLRRLYLGPYSGRSLDLRSEIAGVLSNPNGEFEANFIPLRTLALWNKAAGKWDSEEAYRAALQEWIPAFAPHEAMGDGTSSLEQVRWLSDCFHLPFQHGARARQMLADIERLLYTPPSMWADEYERCRDAGAAIAALFSMLATIKDRGLAYALYRHVWELKEEMHLLLGYLDWLQSGPRPGDVFVSAEHRPGTYRGGLVSELQRLLPMKGAGEFDHRASAIPQNESASDR